jgi:hypothetical protein
VVRFHPQAPCQGILPLAVNLGVPPLVHGVTTMAKQTTPSIADVLAIVAQQQQQIAALLAAATVPTQTEVLDAVAETATPTKPDGTYFVGTVTKVAMHKLGLQMSESEDRYWNIAKPARSKVNFDGIEPGMAVRLTLDAPDAPDHTARVIGWAPADAPMPTKGKTAPRKGANNGKGQQSSKATTGKGAASAVSAPSAPTKSARERLTEKAAALVLKHRAAHGVDGSCPFCGGKHHKYTTEQIARACAVGQFAKAGKVLDLMRIEDMKFLADYLSTHCIPVYSYNAAGFELWGVAADEVSGAAIAAPSESANPKVEAQPSETKEAQAAPTKPTPKTCGADGCNRWIASGFTHCAFHRTPEAAPSANPKAATTAATATPTAKPSVKSGTSRSKTTTPKIVAKEDSETGDIAFRAIIVKFPDKQTRMVKLIKLDGSGEEWFEYAASLDIARCDIGTVVDVVVRRESGAKSVVLVSYEVVAPPAATKGVETSGKQQPATKPVKHVSNRQRSAARKERAAKATKPEIEWKELDGSPLDTLPDVDAQLEAISARRRLAEMAKSNVNVRMPKVMPGVTVKEDKNGVPQFVVEGSRKAAAARRKNKKPVGLVGEECIQCGRRFTMAGWSSTPGICGRCEAEESEPNV